MSLRCGFYNSENGDREYFNEDLSNFLEGLITDGVFETLGDRLMVQAASTPNMTVNVGTGRAWFNATWTRIDALYPVGITASDPVLSRIDAICLTVNKTRAVRDNIIEVIEGTPVATSPQKPIVEDETNIYRHVLAYVTIPAGATVITQAQIENRVGMGSALFSLPKWGNVPTAEQMAAQWETQFDQMMSGDRTEFDTFMTYVHNTFDYDAATGLQSEIDAIIECVVGIYDSDEYSSTTLWITVDSTTYPNFNLQKGTHIIHRFGSDWTVGAPTPDQYCIGISGDEECYEVWTTNNQPYTGTGDLIIKAGMTAEFLFDGEKWILLSTELLNMKATFQAGVDTIYNAIVAQGVTPASSTPADCAEGIEDITEIEIVISKRLSGSSEEGHTGSGSVEFQTYDGVKHLKEIRITNLDSAYMQRSNSYILGKASEGYIFADLNKVYLKDLYGHLPYTWVVPTDAKRVVMAISIDSTASSASVIVNAYVQYEEVYRIKPYR